MKKIDCAVCCKQNLDKDTIGINKKLLGKEISRFYCIDCLAEYIEVTVEDIQDKIEDFKEQGCTLFR